MTAAGFWRWTVACCIALAGVIAVAFARLLELSRLSAFLLGLSVFVLVPFAICAASFAAARALTGKDERHPAAIGCALRAWWDESLALSRAALTMGTGPPSRPDANVAPTCRRQASPVLLVHGVLCDGHIWASFRRKLETSGFGPVRAIDLGPLFADIDSHAQALVRFLGEMQRETGGAPVAIVTHSMGGLVARSALCLVGTGVVSRLVTLACPHHGTVIARLFPQRPFRQMRPGSPWLRSLNQRQEGELRVPVTSIYSLEDRLVAPAQSAVLRGACMRELRRAGHLSLLTSTQAFGYVLAALEAP